MGTVRNARIMAQGEARCPNRAKGRLLEETLVTQTLHYPTRVWLGCFSSTPAAGKAYRRRCERNTIQDSKPSLPCTLDTTLKQTQRARALPVSSKMLQGDIDATQDTMVNHNIAPGELGSGIPGKAISREFPRSSRPPSHVDFP